VIHLDTSFLVRALGRGSPEDRRLRDWLRAGETLAMSAVGWAEFLLRPVEPDDLVQVSHIIRDPVPFAEADSVLSARLFNLGGRRRHSLLDCMIAAVALRAGAAVATANPSDFQRFEPAGLQLIRL